MLKDCALIEITDDEVGTRVEEEESNDGRMAYQRDFKALRPYRRSGGDPEAEKVGQDGLRRPQDAPFSSPPFQTKCSPDVFF